MTTFGSLHDLRAKEGLASNSTTSFNLHCEAEMHGSNSAFAVEIFAAVENVIGLPQGTMKIGIMDEERRTTVNLKERIRAASKERVVFINTGFDRTGDEIHTSIELVR